MKKSDISTILKILAAVISGLLGAIGGSEAIDAD
jgi:hypothetical protein